MITIRETIKIIQSNNLEGFSIAVKGDLKRYIVANTHNNFKYKNGNILLKDIDKLTSQINKNIKMFDNVTVGGWKDEKTNKIYIDAGISTNNLDYAIEYGRNTNQIAIWDAVEQKEIRI